MKKQKLLLSLFFISFLILASSLIDISYCDEFGDVCDVYQDNWIESINPSNNHGSDVRLRSGYTYIGNGYMYAYFGINTSTVPTQTVPFVYLKSFGFYQTVSQHGYSYVDFRLYKITESWDESTMNFTNKPSMTQIDNLNVSVITDMTTDWFYFNVTDDWSSEYGEGFTDFYGYCLYMDVSQYGTPDIEWFEWYSLDDTSHNSTIFYSNVSLDEFGDAYTEEEEEEENYMGDTNLTTTQFNDFMFLFLFLIVPPIILGIYAREIFGIAFIGGLGLMASMGYVAGIVTLWFLLLIFIVIAIILFAQLKRGIFGF